MWPGKPSVYKDVAPIWFPPLTKGKYRDAGGLNKTNGVLGEGSSTGNGDTVRNYRRAVDVFVVCFF